MITEEAKKNITLTHPNKIFENIQVQDACPQCGSFYLSEVECESCGFQLGFDHLGIPFGERSFYLAKELYQDECPWFWSYLSRDLKESFSFHRKYKRFLLKRFTDLVDALQTLKKDQDYSRLFTLEASQIIHEFSELHGGVKELGLIIHQYDVSDKIMNEVSAFAMEDQQKESEEAPGYWSRSFFVRGIVGILSVTFILSLLLRFLILS